MLLNLGVHNLEKLQRSRKERAIKKLILLDHVSCIDPALDAFIVGFALNSHIVNMHW